MKQFFISSDIHSFYDEWRRALNDADFEDDNPDHVIVVLGDLLDRGPKPLECLRFVNNLPDNRKILITGNHEDLLWDCLVRKEFGPHDYHNGTVETVMSLVPPDHAVAFSDEIFDLALRNEELNKYFDSIVDYAEINNSIFVHGWIPCSKVGKYYTYNDNWDHGDWASARWINGMEAWSQGVRVPDKTIYCGHWHTSWGHAKLHHEGGEWPNKRSTNPEHRVAHFSPFIDDGIVALDACTAFSHKVNVVVKMVNEI